MKDLFNHICNYCNLEKEDFLEIEPFFKTKTVSKKEIIYTSGGKNLKHYFVLSGCLQMYYINNRGFEQTLQFAIKNWWITDYLAFQKNQSSEFYIQAIEPSVILEISYAKQDALLLKLPKLETYFRCIYQIALGAANMRIKYIFSYSKEEVYFRFREAFPDFVNNVPQYLVATYLGLSPEYVSKIRKKKIN
ncbi:Crp/Fnr family transcriptional regulator [Algibacter sp. PT7-4]|uniref:Crp/Fnr family transcriptional regulator n=1 Tax=Algibacter ulvanivorans TaxID=3400999 RepID=UPI003AABE37A